MGEFVSGEAMHTWAQGFYGRSLCFHLSFAVNVMTARKNQVCSTTTATATTTKNKEGTILGVLSLTEMRMYRGLARVFSRALILLRWMNVAIGIFVNRHEKAVHCS